MIRITALLLPLALLLLLQAPKVNGNLKCLQCDSTNPNTAAGCSDASLQPSDCGNAEHEVCSKSIINYDDGTRRYLRRCEVKPAVADPHTCKSWNDLAWSVTKCLCPTDGCNSANSFSLSMVSLVLSLLSLLVIRG